MKTTPRPIDAIRDAIVQLAPQLQRGAARSDETDAFATESFEALKACGLHALLIPAEFGGLGCSYAEACEALRCLARSDGSLALTWSMHSHVIAGLRYRCSRGDDSAASTLRRAAAENLVMLTSGGRDWLESNGSMKRVDGGYRVYAHKPFVSGSEVGDLLVSSARFDDPHDGPQVIHFSVPMTATGVRIGERWRAHGMRGTASHTLVLEDVFVPDRAVSLRRPRGDFHPLWNTVLAVAPPLIMAVYVGIADAAVERACRLNKEAAPSSEAIIGIGEAESARVVAQACHERMVGLTNDLDFLPSDALSAEMLALKTATTEAVGAAAGSALDAVGGAGFYRRAGLERLVRDARAAHYHPMPRLKQTQMTGRVALGLSPVRR